MALKIETPKKVYELSWAETDTLWKDTIFARIMQPILDFLVRAGEIIVLAGALQAAANATHNMTLQIAAGAMFFALSLQLALFWGRCVYFPLVGVKVKATKLNFVLLLMSSFALVALQTAVYREVVAAAKALAVPATGH